MIARINTGKSVSGAAYYNEDKIINGEATLIDVTNFPSRDQLALTMYDIINVLEDLAARNTNISEQTIHIALSFHPTDNMTDDLLKTIASEYMDRLGYGNQPTVVYRHDDTQHPHIHILTVSIDDEGKKISDSLIRVRSNEIRKELEAKYGLIKAENQINNLAINILPERAIEYGKAETKKAIGTVIQTAFKDYSFSNLSEFDQFIKNYGVQMNVREGKGEKNWKGLTFQITDGDKPLSPEVKASSYHFSPTYEKLQSRFRGGVRKKEFFKPVLIKSIRESLKAFEKVSDADFKNQLREKGIQVIDDGKTFLYIDHKKRTVYSESDLGAQFSRAWINKNLVSQSVLRSPAEPKPAVEIEKPVTQAEQVALGKQVSKHYQQFKKERGITFESQVITNFPYKELVDALKATGKDDRQATSAVSEFERYKKSQLPDILGKERAYFEQTTKAYVDITRQMPITVESRFGFLEKVQLKLVRDTQGNSALQHEKNPDLSFPLSHKQYQELMRGTALSVPFLQPLSGAEKKVYLAAATGASVEGLTFTDVRVGQLKKTLPGPIYERISADLNSNQLTALAAIQPPANTAGKPDLFTEFYLRRGIVIALDKGIYKAGFHTTPPASFQPLPAAWLNELKRTGMPDHGMPDHGMPAGYADSVARLRTEPGRLLIQYVQGMDSNSVNRTGFVERRAAETDPAMKGLQGEGLIDALQKKMAALPVPGPEKVGILTRNDGPEDPQTKLINKVLFRDYSMYRTVNGFDYESSLLKKPDQFPGTRLMATLTQPPHSIEAGVAAKAVAEFKAGRLSQFQKIEETDRTNFSKISTGYLNMVGKAPISDKDKIGVLNALSYKLERSSTGENVLVHKSDPSLSHRLTDTEYKGIRDKVVNPTRISIPEKEFPRYERQLYQTLALGGKLTYNPEEKNPITFLNLNAERARTILNEAQWHNAATWLNANTMGVALHKAPIDGREKVSWLYQRGLVVEPTGTGYRIGHYLTKPDQYTNAPTSLVAVIDANRDSIQTPANQQRALETPRGKIMIELATALDNGNPKQIGRVVENIVGKMPEFGPLATDPQRLLDELSKTSGPYRDPVLKAEMYQSEDREPQEDNSDNLGALADAMTTQKPKKHKMGGGQGKVWRPKRSR